MQYYMQYHISNQSCSKPPRTWLWPPHISLPCIAYILMR